MGPRAHTRVPHTYGVSVWSGRYPGEGPGPRTHVSTISGSGRAEGEGGCGQGGSGTVDWTGMEGNERGRRGWRVSSHRILTDGDCLCWLMATYVAHTSHYEASFSALTHGPLLSPWLRRRRVMANTLRIKCILSPSAWWHPYATAPQITFTFTPRSPCPRFSFIIVIYPFFPLSLFFCVVVVAFVGDTNLRPFFCAFERDAPAGETWEIEPVAFFFFWSWLKFRSCSFRLLWLGFLLIIFTDKWIIVL